MTVVYDFSDMAGMQFTPGNAKLSDRTTFLKTAGDDQSYTFSSLTSEANFFFFNVPGKLTTGAKLTVVAEIRKVSGSDIQIGFDSYIDATFGGTNGNLAGRVFGDNVFASNDEEYVTYRVTHTVGPTHKYVRMACGYFFANQGTAQVRNLRLYIENTDISKIKPVGTARYTQFYNQRDLLRTWVADVVGAGNSISSSDTGVAISSTTVGGSNRSQLILSSGGTSLSNQIEHAIPVDGASHFECEVDAQVTTDGAGLMSCYVRHIAPDNTVLATSSGVFTNKTRMLHRFPFVPYPGSDRVLVSVGSDGDSFGFIRVYSVGVKVYGGRTRQKTNGVTFIGGTLRNDGGTWVIDDDTNGGGNLRYSSMGLTELINNSDNLVLRFEPTTKRPTIIAAMDSSVNGTSDYYCNTTLSARNQVTIKIYNRGNDSIADPSTMGNGLQISVVGFSST